MTEAGNSRNPRNRWVPLITLVALFSCCGSPTFFTVVPYEGPRVERLKADLDEQLPDGSSWEQAEAWFASRGYKTHDLHDRDRRRIGLATEVPNSTLFCGAFIRIELAFDDSGNLQKRIIYRATAY